MQAVSHFHLPWNADEALWQEVQGQLAAFRRVVISITGSAYVSDRDVAFLEGLNLRAPLVYTFFYLLPYIATSDARTCQIQRCGAGTFGRDGFAAIRG